MAKLVAISGLSGLLPVSETGCELRASDASAITSITPEMGAEKLVSALMIKQLGLRFPAANRATINKDVVCIWMGAGQAFLLGKAPRTLKGAALSDQSDGWVVMRLSGENAAVVLARLVPIDLRTNVFKSGFTARTMLYHMPLSLTRTGVKSFELMVFRSMALTAVHDISAAMNSVAAQ